MKLPQILETAGMEIDLVGNFLYDNYLDTIRGKMSFSNFSS